jgi:hypothetical protein
VAWRVGGFAIVLSLACTGPVRAPQRGGGSASPKAEVETMSIDRRTAQRFAELALSCVHREYPNKIAHVLASDDDVAPPRALTPAFYGCFDWHSAVHGHWMLARLAQRFAGSAIDKRARAALGQSLTPEHIADEVAYLSRADRDGFERPYGLAWLLQLCAELRTWNDPQARTWTAAIAPLERLAVERLAAWIPKLTHPIRIGEHAQTAFAFGLALDWAEIAGDRDFAALLRTHAERLHGGDRGCPLAFEPSGHDFLSPCLGAADLMRRVLPPDRFATWLDTALPDLPRDGDRTFLRPVAPSDRSDGKLVHLDGLNLSRAWMLQGIAAGLAEGDPRRPALLSCASDHAHAGLTAIGNEHYAATHWLGTFAVYLVTQRGI